MAQPLSQRLAKFRENFKKVLGPKRQGYGELGQLEEPLVADDEHEGQTGSRVDYARQHGVAPPSQGRQQQHGHPMGGTVADVPSQVRLLWLLKMLRTPCVAVSSAADACLFVAGCQLA